MSDRELPHRYKIRWFDFIIVFLHNRGRDYISRSPVKSTPHFDARPRGSNQNPPHRAGLTGANNASHGGPLFRFCSIRSILDSKSVFSVSKTVTRAANSLQALIR